VSARRAALAGVGGTEPLLHLTAAGQAVVEVPLIATLALDEQDVAGDGGHQRSSEVRYASTSSSGRLGRPATSVPVTVSVYVDGP
jgi:hypothetical protein